MTALRLVSDNSNNSPPPYVARRECFSPLRLSAFKEHADKYGTQTKWQSLTLSHRKLDEAEHAFAALQRRVDAGTAKQEALLAAAKTLNGRCDLLREKYRVLLDDNMGVHDAFIDYTDPDLGEVDQMAELKDVLINARARRAMMDYCGPDLTMASERIACGADLAWAEREFKFTADGWIAFKHELDQQLRKMI